MHALLHLPKLPTRTLTERLAEAGIEPSVGSVGDSYDNALAETINGATGSTTDRLLAPIGNLPPAEAQERFYA